MGPVLLVARMRLRRRALAVVVAGLLLAIGFGVSLASVATARQTASAYDRILTTVDAPDAVVATGTQPDVTEAEIAGLDGVVDVRTYAGYVGRAEGVNPLYTLALIASTGDRFPVERPFLRAGRLPNPEAADEVFASDASADGAGLQIGQHLAFSFFALIGDQPPARAGVTVVGIGTLPTEIVSEETSSLPVFVFTRAFFENHREYVAYGATSIDLAAGYDAREDLGRPITETLGLDFQAVRTQDRERVMDALRPTIIVVLALGALAFIATVVAAGQIVQRRRDEWADDSARLVMAGMTRGQMRLVQIVTTAVLASLAAAGALVVMAVMSPIAPIGPLHDFDPGQGFGIDWAVAGFGLLAVVATMLALALAFSPVPRRERGNARPRRSRFVPAAVTSMTGVGLALALRADRGRGRFWRSTGSTTIATALFALTSVFVASAALLTSTPSRYGFDADVVALNQYGDQPAGELARAFVDVDDVTDATAYTNVALNLNGRVVPGLAATALKGELHPTLLQGRAPRAPDEIVVGQDTRDLLGLELGRPVAVEISSRQREGATPPFPMRIVGVVTFPSIGQSGSDAPRLGTGALVTRDAYVRMRGQAENAPEFTVARLRAGSTPAEVIGRFPATLSDISMSVTEWFTDTTPAELVQLEETAPYLRGSLVVGFLVVLAVLVHGLWTLVRSNGRDLANLRAMGCTPRQLDTITTTQVFPAAFAALVFAVPIGVAAGRWLYSRFAHSLAVVDDASNSAVALLALVGAVLVAVAIAAVTTVVLVRRRHITSMLREA